MNTLETVLILAVALCELVSIIALGHIEALILPPLWFLFKYTHVDLLTWKNILSPRSKTIPCLFIAIYQYQITGILHHLKYTVDRNLWKWPIPDI